MAAEITLSAAEAASTTSIQEAIDALAGMGGTVELPDMELELDRGLELRSGVTLAGQGKGTVLRLAPARIYPLASYHNYGMRDVPLIHTAGLKPGMTVAIRDRTRGGWLETFARLTWVESNWVGLDVGLASDYDADAQPELITSFPMIYAQSAERVGVRDLVLDGQRALQPGGIGACRGGAIYFVGCRHFDIRNVQQSAFPGDGISLQMCAQGNVRACHCDDNAGNGFHPGSGSTGLAFEDCRGMGNLGAGLYFCVRANHITLRRCTFSHNGICGISVGTRDCLNRIESCHLVDNLGPGLLFRESPRPVEVHSVLVRRCTIEGNAITSGRGQIEVQGDAHDLALQELTVRGCSGRRTAGIWIDPKASAIWLYGNHTEGCDPGVAALQTSLLRARPEFECGYEAMHQVYLNHLPLVER